MDTSLVDALQKVDLKAGRTYECNVGDLQIEVRVREKVPDLLPAPLESADVMLDPWADFVMQRLGIQIAFAFDDHFRQFGIVTVVP